MASRFERLLLLLLAPLSLLLLLHTEVAVASTAGTISGTMTTEEELLHLQDEQSLANLLAGNSMATEQWTAAAVEGVNKRVQDLILDYRRQDNSTRTDAATDIYNSVHIHNAIEKLQNLRGVLTEESLRDQIKKKQVELILHQTLLKEEFRTYDMLRSEINAQQKLFPSIYQSVVAIRPQRNQLRNDYNTYMDAIQNGSANAQRVRNATFAAIAEFDVLRNRTETEKLQIRNKFAPLMEQFEAARDSKFRRALEVNRLLEMVGYTEKMNELYGPPQSSPASDARFIVSSFSTRKFRNGMTVEKDMKEDATDGYFWQTGGNRTFDGFGFFKIINKETGHVTNVPLQAMNQADGKTAVDTFIHGGASWRIKHGWIDSGLYRIEIRQRSGYWQPFDFVMSGDYVIEGDTHSIQQGISTNQIRNKRSNWDYNVATGYIIDGKNSRPLVTQTIVPMEAFKSLASMVSSVTYDYKRVKNSDRIHMRGLASDLAVGVTVYIEWGTASAQSVAQWINNDLREIEGGELFLT
eukprot:GILK01003009.1.p1 GENE.GILK01003009.1~~GILK01003009.1.p1  ORF type:complete len:538 (+),score=101.47 GILK01003009.1:48-1616(+)